MKKYFVRFFSPGTLVSESTVEEIVSWDVDKACDMARGIQERHGATPYGFRFETRERKDDDLDSQVTEKSDMYYLGGEVRTLEEIKAENDSANRILISNMECNGYGRIVINNNSWKWTQPLKDGDVVLDWKPGGREVKLKGGCKRVFEMVEHGWIPCVDKDSKRGWLEKGREVKPARYRHVCKVIRFLGGEV